MGTGAKLGETRDEGFGMEGDEMEKRTLREKPWSTVLVRRI